MLIDHTDQFQLPIQLPIRLAGSVASGILNNVRRGRVAALFDSSFYIETEHGFVCVGNQNLAPCPLNLVTTAPPIKSGTIAPIHIPVPYINGQVVTLTS